jgi:hypothetical protein
MCSSCSPAGQGLQSSGQIMTRIAVPSRCFPGPAIARLGCRDSSSRAHSGLHRPLPSLVELREGPDSELELFTAAATTPATAFVHVGQLPDTPRFLHADFAEAVRVALAAGSELSPIAAHQRDVRFAVGDEVFLDTDHAPLPSRSLLSPRWMGPFKVHRRSPRGGSSNPGAAASSSGTGSSTAGAAAATACASRRRASSAARC